jgi:outer membrane protein W
MRTLITGLLISLLISSAALAQQKNGFSLFVSDVSFISGAHESHWYGGVGVAWDRMITPHLSGQLAFAAEQHRTYPYLVGGSGEILPIVARDVRTYPIDLAARYHFLNTARWKPYVGLGLRYVGAPQADARFRYKSHVSPQIVGGVAFAVRPTWSLVLEGRQLLSDHGSYDPMFKASVGVSWHF